MTTTARMLWAGSLVALTLPLGLALWGFSVDDAWIISRVVENGLHTGTLSFNADGARTDAVTPLGYAELLAVLCRVFGSTDAFTVARLLGLGCHFSSLAIAAWCALAPAGCSPEPTGGHAASRATCWIAWATTAGLSPTLAAWAGAGLETPVVGLACTAGCALWERSVDRRAPASGFLGAGFLGTALAWRPELLGFALAAALQLERIHHRAHRGRVGRLALFLLPACAVALARLNWFGTPLPLSLQAKAPDLAAGLRYLVGSALLCGPLVLVVLLGHAKSSRAKLWLGALGAHGVCVLLAGGDWMPLYRLWAPVLPWLICVGVRHVRASRVTLGFLLLGAAASSALLVSYGASTRAVVERRTSMVQELRPLLRESRVTATVDIGWVGRATKARVVDLAGVTDPRVAALPGGHTSRRIDPGFFAARSVDTWLVRARDRRYVPGDPVETVAAAYLVDARLLHRASDLGFRGIAVVPLPHTREQYVVLRHVP